MMNTSTIKVLYWTRFYIRLHAGHFHTFLGQIEVVVHLGGHKVSAVQGCA